MSPPERASGPSAAETAPTTATVDTTSIVQPMPELSPDQLGALRADITANGVLVPVVRDQYGRIIDGHNRAAIAAELGIEYPVQVVEIADDNDAMDRAVSLNCTRRHLTRS